MKWPEPERAPKLPSWGCFPLAVAVVVVAVTSLLILSLSGQREEGVLRVEGVIVDAQTGKAIRADVYLDGRLLYEEVASFSVEVPKGSELRVVAEGYHPWALRFSYPLREDSLFRGPVRLRPKER
jgi:hypothetical protein